MCNLLAPFVWPLCVFLVHFCVFFIPNPKHSRQNSVGDLDMDKDEDETVLHTFPNTILTCWMLCNLPVLFVWPVCVFLVHVCVFFIPNPKHSRQNGVGDPDLNKDEDEMVLHTFPNTILTCSMLCNLPLPFVWPLCVFLVHFCVFSIPNPKHSRHR
jgi:hypothetical protein